MPSDYAAIREENRADYGKRVGEYGPLLLTSLYDDRTHFIFEILQNAEDALARRKVPAKSGSVTFDIQNDALLIRHYGDPFNETDVRSICRIVDSGKEFAEIGKFGIGFKSVYAYTDRPEIHSGHDHFAIESLVYPTEIPAIKQEEQETVIRIPFDKPEVSQIAQGEIAEKIEDLGMETLLFLKEIKEILWNMSTDQHGRYWKETQEWGHFARKVRLYATDQPEQDWIVVVRPVFHQKTVVGSVQIAFLLEGETKSQSIRATDDSPLFAFFKTILSTNFKFLIHGPYRTTPSRDNILHRDPWNIHLINETAQLIGDAILWLRDQDLINAEFLEDLAMSFNPVWSRKPDIFNPISQAVQSTIENCRVLPKQGDGYVSVETGKIGTGEVRDFLSPSHLTNLIPGNVEQSWISDSIGRNRTPRLYNFLTIPCAMPQIDPSWLLRNLTQEFLEQQNDEWIQDLYIFFNGRLLDQADLSKAPLIRLENGRHVRAIGTSGTPSAFLPGEQTTGFRTVRASVCENEDAINFLEHLGIHRVDHIQDVLMHVIPKYRNGKIVRDETEYIGDIRRIISAFDADPQQRKTFVAQLRKTPFVRAIDSIDRIPQMVQPDAVYWPTEDIQILFSGVPRIFFVDTESIPDELIRSLEPVLSSCGSLFHFTPVESSPRIDQGRRGNLRKAAGHERITRGRSETIKSWMIPHLTEVLEILPTFHSDSIRKRSESLWNLLFALYSKNSSVFYGKYTWYDRKLYNAEFDAEFIELLRQTPWIVDASGTLRRPAEVVFDELGWQPHPEIQKQIGFKPAAIAELAALLDIDPELLEHLIADGITNMDELERKRPLARFLASSRSRSRAAVPPQAGNTPPRERRPYVQGESGSLGGPGERANPPRPNSQRTRNPGQPRTRNEGFRSYVQVHPEEQDSELSDAERQRRLDLERMAVQLIREWEPNWIVAPPNTPGYDLYMLDERGEAVEWCEVKSLSGSLDDWPVRVSHTQFDFAREKGAAFWLYVVEHAGDAEQADIHRIQDPAGLARTFTFDRGWRDVALKD